MVKFTDVSFGFPQKDLYEKICFEIEPGEHAALIGSNGTGKSTLIDMIIRTDEYLYDGKIEKENCGRIGFVSQFVKHESEQCTVFEYLSEPFTVLQKKADELCAQMGDPDADMTSVYEEYQYVLDEIDAIDGYNYETNIKMQLATAGISHLQESSIGMISGGEFKLITIIKNMLTKPQLLIMDEPDVFLDFENIVGLSKLINNYGETLIAITHSRLLLSQCFNKILHLENKELQEFPGTFAQYNRSMLETKVEMLEQSVKESEFIEIQKAVLTKLRNTATLVGNPTIGRQVHARATYLARLIERKTPDPFIEDFDYEFDFPQIEEPDPEETVISVKDYSLAYDREILSNVSFEIKAGEKVALVGANGTGKSSILRDIYKRMSENEQYTDKVDYFSQVYDGESDSENREKLSGGEQNMKQLRQIASGTASILFLDEPTSHLDTYAQIALENAIQNYKGTVLMVTHDFYTVANCADRILILENGSLREMSSRAYRKSIYKKYFDSDIFEAERLRKETEVRINRLIKAGKYKEAKEVLGIEN